jgi:hypothetical protein
MKKTEKGMTDFKHLGLVNTRHGEFARTMREVNKQANELKAGLRKFSVPKAGVLEQPRHSINSC